MTDTIVLYDEDGLPIASISDPTVTLSFGSTGLPYYNSTLVGEVVGTLDADVLTIATSGSGLVVNDIRAKASGANVSSFLSWGTNPANNAFELKMTTPRNSGEWMEWKFGATVPPIKLKVKIVRR